MAHEGDGLAADSVMQDAPSIIDNVHPETREFHGPSRRIALLLNKAESLASIFEYEAALKFAKRAAEMDGSSADAVQMVGQLHADVGDIEQARSSFQVALYRCQDKEQEIELFLSLANLSGDKESIRYYNKALDAMLGLREAVWSKQPLVLQEKELSIVEVCMAEIEVWMTECCFEAEASTECDRLLELALSVKLTPALLAAAASVRVSQQRHDEAQKMTLQALEMIGIDAQGDSMHYPETLARSDLSFPNFAQRMTLIRMCIETKLYLPARSLLADATAEQDDEAEAWYLFGYLEYLLADLPDSPAEAQAEERPQNRTSSSLDPSQIEHITRAHDLLEKAVSTHQSTQNEDLGILEHATELLSIIHAAAPSLSAESEVQKNDSGVPGTDDEQSPDEWTDASSSSEHGDRNEP